MGTSLPGVCLDTFCATETVYEWAAPGVSAGIRLVVIGCVPQSPAAGYKVTSVSVCRDARRAETYKGYFDFNQIIVYALCISYRDDI